MARLRKAVVYESESFADSDVSSSFAHSAKSSPTSEERTRKLRTSPRKAAITTYRELAGSDDDEVTVLEPVLQLKTTPKSPNKRIRLAPLSSLSPSRLLKCKVGGLETNLELSEPKQGTPNVRRLRSPSKANWRFQTAEKPPSRDSSVEIEVDESIWRRSHGRSDSSEEELPSPRNFLRKTRKALIATEDVHPNLEGLWSRPQAQFRHPPSHPFQSRNKAADLASDFQALSIAQSRPSSSSDKENNAAFLRFSPPRLYSPQKHRNAERPATPPQSPSKSRLQSPTKARTRVPTPPIGQSLDAFWTADTVNDWNDQYSPQKILKSPRKANKFREQLSTSPSSSPRKLNSPTKADREAKKTFESSKHQIAVSFLAELDTSVTNGQIQDLARCTGGVHFVWSKTLNSTAGRANWRRETTKTRKLDGTTEITHKHHASIELAEKVIDDEHRLLNVIAHEFCHLATFMISGIKDQPHGKQFKAWGKKCTDVFASRSVEVTTKHTYQIEYKYIWQCRNEECAAEFKRHSKSIDPNRHTCGSCRNRLVQIKPVPRKDAQGVSGYAVYVKENFAKVKSELPQGSSQKEVMEALGRQYRAEKEAGRLRAARPAEEDVHESPPGKATEADVDDVACVLEAIVLDD